MLAKFENGYFLKVKYVKKYNEYVYTVYDEKGCKELSGHTEYRSIDMYYPMNEIDYILAYCEPAYVEGKYELLSVKSVEEYLKSTKR